MLRHDLIAYIETASHAGKGRRELMQELSAAGWSEQEIRRVLYHAWMPDSPAVPYNDPHAQYDTRRFKSIVAFGLVFGSFIITSIVLFLLGLQM